jgi:hypothetical protein
MGWLHSGQAGTSLVMHRTPTRAPHPGEAPDVITRAPFLTRAAELSLGAVLSVPDDLTADACPENGWSHPLGHRNDLGECHGVRNSVDPDQDDEGLTSDADGPGGQSTGHGRDVGA